MNVLRFILRDCVSFHCWLALLTSFSSLSSVFPFSSLSLTSGRFALLLLNPASAIRLDTLRMKPPFPGARGPCGGCGLVGLVGERGERERPRALGPGPVPADTAGMRSGLILKLVLERLKLLRFEKELAASVEGRPVSSRLSMASAGPCPLSRLVRANVDREASKLFLGRVEISLSLLFAYASKAGGLNAGSGLSGGGGGTGESGVDGVPGTFGLPGAELERPGALGGVMKLQLEFENLENAARFALAGGAISRMSQLDQDRCVSAVCLLARCSFFGSRGLSASRDLLPLLPIDRRDHEVALNFDRLEDAGPGSGYGDGSTSASLGPAARDPVAVEAPSDAMPFSLVTVPVLMGDSWGGADDRRARFSAIVGLRDSFDHHPPVQGPYPTAGTVGGDTAPSLYGTERLKGFSCPSSVVTIEDGRLF